MEFSETIQTCMDTMCRCAYNRKIPIPLFWGRNFDPFELWLYIEQCNKQFVSATPLTLLHGIYSKNFVGTLDNICKCACMLPGNFDSIISLGIFAFFELRIWSYTEYINKQFVSATPLKPMHGIQLNIVGINV